jgi:enoyl-CoA hydratase
MRGMSSPDTVIFPWKMTMAQAKYIQITGNSITGRQAAEWGWVVKSFPADELDAEVGRELHVLRNIDPSILAANKMAVNQAYEVMGIRTHVEQSWVWHHLSNLARARSSGSRGVAGDRTIRDSLAWMNQAADEVGLL